LAHGGFETVAERPPQPACAKGGDPCVERRGQQIRGATADFRPHLGGGRGLRELSHVADEVLAAELAAEQAFVDQVYVQLDRSARNAEALAREGYGRGALGHEGGLV